MNNDQLLIDQFFANHPDLALATIEQFELAEIAVLVEHLPLNQSTAVLSNLPHYKAGKVLEKVTLEHATRMVEHLALPDAESILRVAEETFRDRLLNDLPVDTAKLLRRSLSFSKNQIGARLEPYVLTLSEHMKIADALIEIKETVALVRPLLFVLDAERKLVGYVETNALVSNDPGKAVQSVMIPMPHTVFAEMTIKDVLENWNDSFVDLPVVKTDGEFLGVVSRASLAGMESHHRRVDNSVVKAGNALGDLYLIGLTALLGSSDTSKN